MRIAPVGLLLSVLMLGCGDAGKEGETPALKPAYTRVAGAKDKVDAIERAERGPAAKDKDRNGEGKKEAVPQAGEVPRKIIYTAHLDLVVEDLDKAQTSLEEDLEEAKGYIARSELRGQPGQPRDGHWTLRVPVAQFDTLRKELSKLGVINRNSVDSEDITDRFYDTQARLKNNQVEEEGLRKLYLDKAASSKMEELLAIRRELANVRGTVEEQQGQINRWDKQSRLATIELHLVEVRDYVPPDQPGFGASVRGTFRGSIDALISLGKGTVLVVVALVPWVPLLALLTAVIWLLVRRRQVRSGSI